MSSSDDKLTNECRIRMKWRLKEDFLKEKLKDSGNGSVHSDIFNASLPGVKYSLSLELDKQKNVSIFMGLEFEMTKKIRATCIFSVKSASYVLEGDGLCEIPTLCGNKLCAYDELFNPEKKYFVDGIMEIELEATLKAHGIKRKATGFLSLANALWKSDDKDVTITVKEQKFMVHKWVLCTKSPVFKAELNSGMKEAIENTINITDFTFECVKTAMEFCYERNIDKHVTEENASELLHFADKYDIKPMHCRLQNLLIEKISASNVCKLANMTVTSNATELREYCICFLIDAGKKEIIVKDANELNAEILQETGRRSLFFTSDTAK